jgi:hypothetical protein
MTAANFVVRFGTVVLGCQLGISEISLCLVLFPHVEVFLKKTHQLLMPSVETLIYY